MMQIRKLLAAGAAATMLFAAGAAEAAIVFVGSWRLTDGPAHYGPLSGQQAAALLFGGDAADYIISTAGDSVATVDGQAWYLAEVAPGAAINDSQDATEFLGGDLTAYGFDPEVAQDADRWVNFAFRDVGDVGGIPEPATWALMIGGFGLAGATLRRRRSTAAA